METIFAAFLIGGALCAAFQLIESCTRSTPPVMLLISIGAGALATVLGIMPALGEFAGAGTGILVVGFGEALCLNIVGALSGDWSGVATTSVVIVLFVLMGIIAGTGHLLRAKRASTTQDSDSPQVLQQERPAG